MCIRDSLKGQGGIGEILSREHFLGNSAVHSDGITFQHGEGLVGGGGGNFTIVNAIHARQSGPALSNGIGEDVYKRQVMDTVAASVPLWNQLVEVR